MNSSIDQQLRNALRSPASHRLVLMEHWERVADLMVGRDTEVFGAVDKDCALHISERLRVLGDRKPYAGLLRYYSNDIDVLNIVYGFNPHVVMQWLTRVSLNEYTGDDVIDWIVERFGERRYEPLLARLAKASTPPNESRFISCNVDLLAFYPNWFFRPVSNDLAQLCVLAGYAHKLTPRTLSRLEGGIRAYRQEAKLDELLAEQRGALDPWLHIELNEFVEPYELSWYRDPARARTYAEGRGPEYLAQYLAFRGE
jgi:hypothetical protein